MESETTVQSFLEQVEKTSFFGDEKTKGSLAGYILFYERGAPPKRWLFQLTGSLVIFLSVTLPFIAAFGDNLPGSSSQTKDLIIAIYAVLIALFSGLNAFYRWDRGWRGAINSKLALQNLKSHWEIKKIEALLEPDHAKGFALLQEATEKLISDTNLIVSSETQEFFTLIRFPDSKSNSQG